MSNRRWEELGAAAGVVFVVAQVAANDLMKHVDGNESPSFAEAPATVDLFMTRDGRLFGLGDYLMTLVVIPFVWWLSVLWARLRRTEGTAVQVVAADGATTDVAYDGLVTTTVDPNDHQTAHENDRRGRLVKVKEYLGTGTGSDPYELYATTSYTYDPRDLLAGVTVAPDVVFTYSDKDNRASCNLVCTLWVHRRLTTLQNGWGAQVDYSYGRDGRTGEEDWCNWRVNRREYDAHKRALTPIC